MFKLKKKLKTLKIFSKTLETSFNSYIKIYKSSSDDQIFPEDFYWSAVVPPLTIIYFSPTT